MKCAQCNNDIGRAQVICDGCGVLLTEESSRIETRKFAPAGESQKTVQKPAAQVKEPVEQFEAGQDLSPEQVMAALGSGVSEEALAPAEKSQGIQISKEQIAEALASKTVPPSAASAMPVEPASSSVQSSSPQSSELPPTASLDYMDSMPLAEPSNAKTPVLPEIEIPEALSSPTPASPQAELKAEAQEPVLDTGVDNTSATGETAVPKTGMKMNILIWAIVVFFPLLSIISWVLCWKSSWPKKHKIGFIVGTGLYVGFLILISLLPFILVMLFAEPAV